MMVTTRMSRRQFFGKLGEGSLVVGFSLSPVAASMLAREAHAASADSQLTVLSGIASGSPAANDAWLTIDHQGNVTLFSGKVEIGTGTQTAFSQIVAEELDGLVSDSLQTDLQAALTNSANVYASDLQEVVGNFDTAYNMASGSKLTRTYYSPYHMHGSVGPSCAVANVTSAPDANGIQATVWSGTQGVYPLQQALSDILRLPQSAIRVIYAEGAGCYGHNGADDAAADAALMSQLVGRPVRVQWMRWDEHAWEPLGPAMAHTLKGALDSRGNVVAWSHTVNSPPHSSRPGGGGSLLAGQEIGLIPPLLPTAPVNAGTRNGPVNYNFPAIKLSANHVQPYKTTSNGAAASPFVNTLPRSTALRSLGGMSNSFANESFMDELALAAHADPIFFRENYVCALSGSSGSATSVPVPGVDQRAVAALEAMAKQAGWGNPLAPAGAGAVAGKGVALLALRDRGNLRGSIRRG